MLGKIEVKRRRGRQRMRWLYSITDSRDMNLSKFWEIGGFPGGTSGKEPACKWRRRGRCRFSPWVRKIPWRRKWQPTRILLPGKFHGQRSLEGYNPWDCKGSDMTEGKQHAKHICTGDSGQRRLVCYSPWGCRVEHDLVTEHNKTKKWIMFSAEHSGRDTESFSLKGKTGEFFMLWRWTSGKVLLDNWVEVDHCD